MGWDLKCLDWQDRLRTGRSLVPDLPLDLVAGNRAVAVFDKLQLHDVPGTPTNAVAGGEWFRAIVRAMFRSADPVTGARMIRELFLLVPKKNNKTTGGAHLMLTALLLNQRPKANFILTGPVQDSADTAFQAAAGAIALDDVLQKKLHVREHLKLIIHRETKAELQIMTFDPAVLTGQKVSGGVLIDELHVIAKMAKAASAIRQLRGGMLPFPEAFLAFITTQSEEAPAGVFKAELTKARAIRDGRQQGVMLPVLYEFSEAVQRAKDVEGAVAADAQTWRNPALWPMVTPNAGRSITIDRLIEEMTTAEQTSKEELRAWASQHLNVEIGLALHANRWPGADYWEQQEREDVTFDALLERCEVIDVGIDGGGLDDLLGLAAVGRDRKTGEWLGWAHAWAHKSVLERRKSEAPKLLDFVADGDLTLVAKVGDDVAELAEYVRRIHAAKLLDLVGVDPAGIGAVLDALDKAGIPTEMIIGISQGWKMTGAVKTGERKLAEGVLIVACQALMRWCVGNAKVVPAGNAVLITKQASGTGKIDPLMALLNAIDLISRNPAAPKKASYQMLTLG